MDDSFYYPAHVDGRTVVILRRTRLGFEIVESGCLSYDGATLWLESQNDQRVVDEEELNALKLVSRESQIPACKGFDFFRIVEDGPQQALGE